MKHISIVYEIEKCGDCPFCKKSNNCYTDGLCTQTGEYLDKYLDKNEMSNNCPLVDWQMVSSKKLR